MTLTGSLAAAAFPSSIYAPVPASHLLSYDDANAHVPASRSITGAADTRASGLLPTAPALYSYTAEGGARYTDYDTASASGAGGGGSGEADTCPATDYLSSRGDSEGPTCVGPTTTHTQLTTTQPISSRDHHGDPTSQDRSDRAVEGPSAVSQTLSSLALAAAASGRQAMTSVLDHVSHYTSTIFQLHPARYILGPGTLGKLYVAADSIGGIGHVAQQYRNTGAAGQSSGFVEGARWTRPVAGWMSSLGGSLVAGLMTLGRAAGEVVKRRTIGGLERERSNGTVGTVGKGDGPPGHNEADTEETPVSEGQLVRNGVLTEYGKQVCNSAPDTGGSDMSANPPASGAGAEALINWVKQRLPDGLASRPAASESMAGRTDNTDDNLDLAGSKPDTPSETDSPLRGSQAPKYSGFGHTPTDFGERQSAWQSTVDTIRRNPRTSIAVGSLAGTGLVLGAAGAIYGSSIGLSGSN